MIHVIASIRIKSGQRSAFLEIFKHNMQKVKKEMGCLTYFPAVDVATGLPPQQMAPNVVTVIEAWESLAALRNHLDAPHMLAYKEKVKDIVEDVTLKVLEEV
jgi:quinol monooxygenase YgiN